jgi:hypothetical protein
MTDFMFYIIIHIFMYDVLSIYQGSSALNKLEYVTCPLYFSAALKLTLVKRQTDL